MRKLAVLIPFLLFLSSIGFSQKENQENDETRNDSMQNIINDYLIFRDSVISAMKYQQGVIMLKGGFAKLDVPLGFKFLNMEQSQYVLHDIWGNPPETSILGMIYPDNANPFTDSSYVFVITFDDMGYVDDDNASDVDYDELLRQIQEDELENNKQREAEGYPSVHTVGWAQKPFYDNKRKVLHWAKDLVFSDDDSGHTLNYDVRVLGRKGVLSLNAVASLAELSLVKENIDKILTMASFTEGNTYADFDDKTDQVAAYTIGGLVAGKILAKVGFWASLVKFWKLIAVSIVAVYYGIRRWLTGKKKPGDETIIETTAAGSENPTGTV